MSEAAEQPETIITFDEVSKDAEIYTASPRVWKLLESRGLVAESETWDCEGETTSKVFTLPRFGVRLKPGDVAINIGGQKPADKKFKNEVFLQAADRMNKKRGVSTPSRIKS